MREVLGDYERSLWAKYPCVCHEYRLAVSRLHSAFSRFSPWTHVSRRLSLRIFINELMLLSAPPHTSTTFATLASELFECAWSNRLVESINRIRFLEDEHGELTCQMPLVKLHSFAVFFSRVDVHTPVVEPSPVRLQTRRDGFGRGYVDALSSPSLGPLGSAVPSRMGVTWGSRSVGSVLFASCALSSAVQLRHGEVNFYKPSKLLGAWSTEGRRAYWGTARMGTRMDTPPARETRAPSRVLLR